ncbi:hypothetical protein [Porphyromonas pogonae]|uniref:hypothetical protein n=1 Tax=Porphyromonas pogonae TaxID=867595 RepID=UPI002E76CF40|nr:hypothetical protein [Porphyromonas pogonae]
MKQYICSPETPMVACYAITLILHLKISLSDHSIINNQDIPTIETQMIEFINPIHKSFKATGIETYRKYINKNGDLTVSHIAIDKETIT